MGTVCPKVDKYVVNRNKNSNEGFVKRRNLLFNNVPNVMSDANAGEFTSKIPLNHLFSFSEGYDQVIYNCKHELRLNRHYNCKHELRLNRQTDDYGVFRSIYADAAKMRLDR